jgi:glycine cleavage system transcriptional repressor
VSEIQNHLIVTALGPFAPINIGELTRACHLSGCNILSTRMNQLGQEMAIILYLSGNWGAIVKMESSLPALETQLGLKLNAKRSCEAAPNEPCHAYNIRVTAIDKPGILSGLALFLYGHGIPINEIDADTYHTRSGTRMLDLSIFVQVPDHTHLATLRDELLTYCDTQNLDAFLEPDRN